jgi:hypothetical protein
MNTPLTEAPAELELLDGRLAVVELEAGEVVLTIVSGHGVMSAALNRPDCRAVALSLLHATQLDVMEQAGGVCG